MNKYIIELRGVEFHNKGAELMLMAILEKIRKELPTAVFVMEKRGESAPINKQRAVGIHTKLNFKKFGIDSAFFGQFIPRKIRMNFGFVLESDINIILDGSGFAFGDFWGANKAGERLADHIVKWKKQGKKVILLSQAFGAFTDEKLQKKMKVILDCADLIFVRDKYSHGYLKTLPGRKDNIYHRPDFTNLTKGLVPSYFDSTQYEVAIIPNNKLLESNTFQSRDEYLHFLKDVCIHINDLGRKPFFLIHEGDKDFKLAKEVNESFRLNIPILKEDNPLHVKGIIGVAVGVVTSRFHGLVSALSQATPCLCVGWSHKYKALMEDYGYAEGILKDDLLKDDGLKEKLRMILEEDSSKNIEELLKSSSITQKELAQDMWDKVFDTIK